MVLVWQIADDLPNSPNFLPSKLSHSTLATDPLVTVQYLNDEYVWTKISATGIVN